MATNYTVTASHPSPAWDASATPLLVKVGERKGPDGTIFWADHPKLGCGKDRATARDAIAYLVEAHGYRILGIELALPTEVNGYPVLKSAPSKDDSKFAVVLCDRGMVHKGSYVCWWVDLSEGCQAYLGHYGDMATVNKAFKKRAGKPYVVTYRAIDGASMRRGFATLKGARKFAQEYVGEHPGIGSSYAVSNDGVGRVTVRGCTLAELFPAS